MTATPHDKLGRRERQILEAVYRLGRASTSDVQAQLPDPPSYSAVRAMLRILEEKGHLRHESDGPRYVYLPIVPRDRARRSALRHVVDTFFSGSVEQAVAALLESSDARLRPEELERLSERIARARKQGR
jgi:predicted transcriptional regulator